MRLSDLLPCRLQSSLWEELNQGPCGRVSVIVWTSIKCATPLDFASTYPSLGLIRNFKEKFSRALSNDILLMYVPSISWIERSCLWKRNPCSCRFPPTKVSWKKSFWFRSICDDLGWEVSAAFCDYFYLILFVICANASLVKTSTSSIKGTWGTSQNQNKVKKALKTAAQQADQADTIMYKESFKLLKTLFPKALKWFSLIYRDFSLLLLRIYAV